MVRPSVGSPSTASGSARCATARPTETPERVSRPPGRGGSGPERVPLSTGRTSTASGPRPASVLDSVRRLVPPSPLLEVPELSDRVGAPAYLKLENLQPTGSFKIRGAAARIDALDAEERRRGVVTCSSGNHGRAVAHVAARLGIPAVVCVPTWVDPVKLEAIRASGAEAVVHGESYDEAATRAREIEAERGLTFVHPFDDPLVVAGQGTVGLEILDAVPGVGTIVLPLSGGGLAGGVGIALRNAGATARLVAASASRASVMLDSLRAGRPVESPERETLASALSGGIELDNEVTFDLVREVVDEHRVVDEDAVATAMAYAIRRLRIVVEGGGAVALAPLLDDSIDPEGRPVVVVVSGGNVSDDVIRRVLETTG